jgi:nitroreductase
MSFLELASKRYSVRKYKDKPVKEEDLLKVLEAGRIAPSACNYQPWTFYVIREKENIDKISKVYQSSWLRSAPVLIIICGNHRQSWRRGDGKDHCDTDLAITTDHMTLQAADLGLGTCWICAFDREMCSKILNLPEHIEPAVILPLGHPDDEGDPLRHTKERKPLSEIVNWEF